MSYCGFLFLHCILRPAAEAKAFAELWHQSLLRDLEPWMFEEHRVDGYPISLIRSLMAYVDQITNISLLDALLKVYTLQRRPLMVMHTGHVIDMHNGLPFDQMRPPVGSAGYGLLPEDFQATEIL